MWISTVSLFPEMFDALRYGVVGKAMQNGLVTLEHCNIRDFADNKHNTVDDRPYGGGPGMVMQLTPVRNAIQCAKRQAPTPAKVVYLSPQGQRFDQAMARRFSHANTSLVLLAGRYEGVDQRLIDSDVDEEWSLGDYILSGGEIAAMAVIDSLTRLIPGVLGHEASAEQDSFSNGLLDYPHYTRPEVVDGKKVPEVLLSGDHHAIMQWRLQQALGQTWLKRQDLLEERSLSDNETELLKAFIRDYQKRSKQ